MAIFFKAPLPFLGQKRNFVKFIRSLDFNHKTVIDLFGGSGLLSHTIKYQCPNARVIYNDFDDYQSRLNDIKVIDNLRINLLNITRSIQTDSRIQDDIKNKMIDAIIASGTKDYLTLSSWLLFSGNYAHSLDQLTHKTWYSRVTKATLTADGYLNDVERVQYDFRDLIRDYANDEQVIFIADPPYSNTNQAGYSCAKHGDSFSAKDTCDLIRLLHDQEAIMFSSAKTNIDDALSEYKPKDIVRINYMASIGFGMIGSEYMYFVNSKYYDNSKEFISQNKTRYKVQK